MARKLTSQAVSSLNAVQFSENRCIFFLLLSKTHEPPFRGWLMTATTSRNHGAICQKEAIESPEMYLTQHNGEFSGFLFLVLLFLFCRMKA